MRRHAAQLASLDLNLLLVLRELLRERNVTRAAERVGVSQPALSAALSRLRRHFGDELLVRVNRTYVLSPLAVQLERQVEDVCAAAEQLFATGSRFSPATSFREFTLLMADYTIGVLGERLSRLVDAEAPHAGLHVRLVRESLALELPHVVRFVDGLIAPPITAPGVPHLRSVELFRDEWVCVVSASNTTVEDGDLTLADLARLAWVVPYHREQTAALAPPVPRQLALLGITPRVAVRVESYQAVPHFIAGTDRIALMQKRLATQFADRLDLRVLDCPGEPEPIVEALWWHEDREQDPAHAWLREVLVDVAGELA
jgi:DNA-binding transcriptional LysR family regulator